MTDARQHRMQLQPPAADTRDSKSGRAKTPSLLVYYLVLIVLVKRTTAVVHDHVVSCTCYIVKPSLTEISTGHRISTLLIDHIQP